MGEKYREVRVWLEKLFGDSAVPQYEVNDWTLGVLHQLMAGNERLNSYSVCIQEDLHQKAKEYKTEGSRLAGILEQLGLTAGSMSESGKASLATLSGAALSLDVHDTSDTSILLALDAQSARREGLQEERRMEQRVAAQLLAKHNAALLQASNLNRALQRLEEQTKKQGRELEKKAKQSAFLQVKASDYKVQAKKLNRELSRSGVDPTIYHATLVKLSQELEELQKKVQAMKTKLASYHSLPPDLALSRAKVEETKHELAKLEEELVKHIDMVHT